MEYSLNRLNKSINFEEQTLNNIVNTLNLIGLEIDAIREEKKAEFSEIYLTIKLPSNRDDLLIERFLLNEFSILFLLQIVDYWKKIQKKYKFLLKQKYLEYQYYPQKIISSDCFEIITYFIECDIPISKKTPLWIKKKLQQPISEKKSSLLDNCFELITTEWSEIFQFSSSIFKNQEFLTESEIHYCLTDETFCDEDKITHIIPKGIVLLKNSKNELLAVLGKFQPTIQQEKIISFEFLFFSNSSVFLKYLNSKVSLKKIQKLFFENFQFSFQRFLTFIEIFSKNSIKIQKFSTKQGKVFIETEKVLILRKKYLQKILNLDLIDEKIFQKAGLKIVCKSLNEIFIKIPNSRKDIQREIDIIEEYSRFIGYQNFLPIFPEKNRKFVQENQKVLTFLKQFFLNYGFVEVKTNPLIEENQFQAISIRINNPLNKEFTYLRTNLFLKLIEIYKTNFRQTQTITNFFEIGRVFSKISSNFFEEEKFATIFQLPISFSGEKNSTNWFVALGFIENFLTNLGYNGIQKHRISINSCFFHPTRSVFFFQNKKLIGSFGEIHPIFSQMNGLPSPTYLFEFNFNHFQNIYSIPKNVIDLSKFPSIKKDLSLSTKSTIDFLKLKNVILTNCQFLKSILFFDIYFQQKKTNELKVGIRLEFQSNFSNLKNDWIDEELKNLQKILQENFELKLEL